MPSCYRRTVQEKWKALEKRGHEWAPSNISSRENDPPQNKGSKSKEKWRKKMEEKKSNANESKCFFFLLARSLHFCRWFDFALFSQGTGSRLCSNWIIYFRIICDWIAVHQFRNAKKSHALSTERERGWKQTRFAPSLLKREKKQNLSIDNYLCFQVSGVWCYF